MRKLQFTLECVMEFDLRILALVYSLVALFLHSSTADGEWDNILVVELGKLTTLVCVYPEMTGAVTVKWSRRPLLPELHRQKLRFVAEKEFIGDSSMNLNGTYMQLLNTNFHNSRVFSLVIAPKTGDEGLYYCLVKQQGSKDRERVILLAVLTATVYPAASPPCDSILRLAASVRPNSIVDKITWTGPGGAQLRSRTTRRMETEAKVPRFSPRDAGTYVGALHLHGGARFSFDVDVKVDATTKASYNETYGPDILTGSVAGSPFSLSCPPAQGDYVLVYWQSLYMREAKLVYHYDRWRGETGHNSTKEAPLLKLSGWPHEPHAGRFSFLLMPEIQDSGDYTCMVYLDDKRYIQQTLLTVLRVTARPLPKLLQLACYCSRSSQVQSLRWSNPRSSRNLQLSSTSQQNLFLNIKHPISANNVGNYTCTMQLKNGQAIWAVYTVTLRPKDSSFATSGPSAAPPEDDSSPVVPDHSPTPNEESGVVTTTPPLPSLALPLRPSLSAILLLLPLVAAAVGVLLWRQRHISQRGIEQSPPNHSWEAENIYEDPEDMRLRSSPGSVYMDLKPGKGDDVYKELDGLETSQC